MRAALVFGLAMVLASTESMANDSWRVVSIDGRAINAGQEATIALTRNRMSGKSFCNRFSVEIQMIRGIRIVGEAASTRMACAPSLMALENRFLRLITPSSEVNIMGGELVIQGTNGGVIRARRNTEARPARPGHLAELEELNAARQAGTIASYDLFLARHPNSRYAPNARAERAKLSR